ncbi:MAG TPA: 3-oxoadipate enol-lactonase [Sphingomonas sp.]|nr:3-oxoadipate enol-lactonase [Sphingomonas sp.]
MAEFLSTDCSRLNVRVEGRADAPVILFAHSVGCDLTLWDRQIEAIGGHYRIIRYDMRGHGGSDAPDGDYRVEQLGQDAIAILDALGVERAHMCGLSLGGTVGQWMALNAPDRLASLTLCDTAARLGTVERWQARIDDVAVGGTGSIADMSMTRFFSEAFRKRDPEEVARFRQILVDTPDQGFAGCCAVLRDCDFRADLARIRTPTIVLCGTGDVATPPSDSEHLARGIPGARLIMLKAGHLSAVEAPEEFNAALLEHVTRQGP